jgi:hypothetical protein
MKKIKSKRSIKKNESKFAKRSVAQQGVKRGSLIVIGTGIKTVGQLTVEAIAWMQEANSLLYVVGDPVAEAVIKRLNPNGAVSLSNYYEEGKQRIYAYNAMVEHILGCVRSGDNTVAAFYGHPGVFAYPSHESIRRARSEGFSARMLVGGCQSYEATDFLLTAPAIDASSQLILWQIGTLGDWTYKRFKYDTSAMPLFVQKLSQFYPMSHLITVYEAPMFPGIEPMISQIPLYSLIDFPITAAMTLYIPPVRTRVPDPSLLYLFDI